MKIEYEYVSQSKLIESAGFQALGFYGDLKRDETFSFSGKIKNALAYREAMLALRDIVVSDFKSRKKDKTDYIKWLNSEIERRFHAARTLLQQRKDAALIEKETLEQELAKLNKEFDMLKGKIKQYQEDLAKTSHWEEMQKHQSEFFRYLYQMDRELWLVLDPVISVHPDVVMFEAFSLDESVYGSLQIPMNQFDVEGEVQYGTTNIDFSSELALELERIRTDQELKLLINPKGLEIQRASNPRHIEKKIDLPESWIQGFVQVSSSAFIPGIELQLNQVDLYDIITFLKRHREEENQPRAMEFILEPNRFVKVKFLPWNQEIRLHAKYSGKSMRIIKVWGRRRLLLLERLLPIAKDIKFKLLGFGMPYFFQFICEGGIKFTIGFTSWTSNDWSSGTMFNVLTGFILKETNDLEPIFKEKRQLTLSDLKSIYPSEEVNDIKANIGVLVRKGKLMYDSFSNSFRYRNLIVGGTLPDNIAEIRRKIFDFSANFSFEIIDLETLEFTYEIDRSIESTAHINLDGELSKFNCSCDQWKKGKKNISQPCYHLYYMIYNLINRKESYLALKYFFNPIQFNTNLKAMVLPPIPINSEELVKEITIENEEDDDEEEDDEEEDDEEDDDEEEDDEEDDDEEDE